MYAISKKCHIRKALEINKKLNDRVSLVKSYTNLGDTHIGKKDNSKSKKAVDNALAVANEFKRDTGTEHPPKNRIDGLLKSINEYNEK